MKIKDLVILANGTVLYHSQPIGSIFYKYNEFGGWKWQHTRGSSSHKTKQLAVLELYKKWKKDLTL